MAAPLFVAAGAGVVITATSGSVSKTGAIAGNFVILHVLQDGTAGSITASAVSNIEALDGTDSSITLTVGDSAVGSPQAAKHRVWMGRVMADGTISLTIATSADDMYARLYEFSGVNTGAEADVFENSSAGSVTAEGGTSASIADSSVTTLDADRLAVNLVAVNDDNQAEMTDFTGETGGTWAYPVTAFGSSTGTDGAIGIITATIASAGTINGGVETITSDPWGTIGFALKPTPPPPPIDPRGAHAACEIYDPALARAILRSRGR